MTRIGFVADVHIGNHGRHGGPVESGLNHRCRQVIETLRKAVDQALAAKCAHFSVLGDLFDTHRPLPQMIAEVQKIFHKASQQNMSVDLLVGNHDQQSTSPGDHALAPLAFQAEVVERPGALGLGESVVLIEVPFQPEPAKLWLPDAIKTALVQFGSSAVKKFTEQYLLTLHLGISDTKTPSFLSGAHDSIDVGSLVKICKQFEIDAVFAGNWHDARSWEMDGIQIHQIGSLCPTGWDNPGLKDFGFAAVWDSEAMELTRVRIPGPRFLKLRRDELPKRVEAIRKARAAGCEIYLQLIVDPAEVSDGAKIPDADKELYAVVEVAADTKVLDEAVRSAAEAAKSSETLEEAIHEFVSNMPLDTSVDRARVLTRAREYLSAGA